MSDQTINIILNGDPSKLKAASAEGVKSMKDLASAGETLTRGTVSQSAVADALIEKVKRQAAGYSDLQKGLKNLEAANNARLLSDTEADKVYARLIDKYKSAVAGSNELGNAHKFAGANTAFATREVRALFDELASGRDRQALGTANLLISRMYGLGLGAMAGLAGVAALFGGLIYLGIKGEESARALNAVQIGFAATGRAGALSRHDVEEWVHQLQLVPGVSKEAAEAIAGQFAGAVNISTEMMKKLTGIIGAYARMTGEDAPKAAAELIKNFENSFQGAEKLDKQYNILTASQQITIEKMHKLGDETGIQGVLFDALSARAKSAAEVGVTPLQTGFERLGKAWTETKNSFADTGFWDDFSNRLADKLGLLSDFISNFKSTKAPASNQTRTGSIIKAEDTGKFDPAQLKAASDATTAAVDRELKKQLDLTAAYRDQAGVIIDLQAKKAALKSAYEAQIFVGAATKEVTDRYTSSMRGLDKAINDQARKGGSLELLQQARKALAVAEAEAANGTLHLTTAQRELAQAMESDAFKRAGATRQAEIKQTFEHAIAVERLSLAIKLSLKGEAEARQEFEDVYTKNLETSSKMVIALEKENETMRVGIEAIGLTRVQRELLLNEKQKEIALYGVIDELDRANIARAYETRAALISQGDAKNQELDFWNQLADRATQGIGNIRGALKSLLSDMASLFLKKWILQLGANLTGSSTLASAAANAGGNGLMGSLTSGGVSGLAGSAIGGIGSLFGSTAISAFGSGLSGAAVGTIAGQGATIAGSATGLGSLAAGGAGAGAASAGATLAAAIPYVAIALAIYALYKKFAGGGGGDKSGGSYQGIYDASGALTGTNSTNLFGLKPNESTGNATQQTATQGAAAAYYALARNLGLKAQALTFSSGYDTDPKGTAETRIKGIVTDANGNRLFSEIDRGIGKGTDRLPAEMQLTISRMIAASVKSSELPDYLKKVFDGVVIESASQTQLDDLIKKLSATKAAWDGLKAGLTQANDVIASLNGDSLPTLRTQMQGLKDVVAAASGAFDASIAGGDPVQIQTAQASLLNAVLNRYAVEKQAIADIQKGLRALTQSTYDFNLANAQRINKYGGKIDVGAIASGRYTDLQSQIDQGGTPEERIANINSFLGAVDTWVSAQQAAIQSQDQAQQQAQAAMAQAQQAAIQSRIQGLQKELQLAQQWSGVLNSAQAAIDKMRLTTSSPDSVFGRLGSASGDVDGLLGRYRGASGASRIDLANQLMAAVNTRQGLGQEAYQRPSAEYLAEYNKNIAILYEVKADAKTEAEKQTDLQSRIEQLTVLGNSYAASANATASQSSAALDAIYAQARELAIYAQDKYDLAAKEQAKALNDQLLAITGGVDVTLYTAQKTNEMRDFLASIDARITAFLTGVGGASTGTGAGTGGGAGGGGNIVNPVGGGNTGGRGRDVVFVNETPIVVNIGGERFANATLRVVSENGRFVRQTIEQN